MILFFHGSRFNYKMREDEYIISYNITFILFPLKINYILLSPHPYSHHSYDINTKMHIPNINPPMYKTISMHLQSTHHHTDGADQGKICFPILPIFKLNIFFHQIK